MLDATEGALLLGALPLVATDVRRSNVPGPGADSREIRLLVAPDIAPRLAFLAVTPLAADAALAGWPSAWTSEAGRETEESAALCGGEVTTPRAASWWTMRASGKCSPES